MMDSITRALAAYAIGAGETDFPARARRYAVDAITDCIGCMLAGAREPLAPMVLNVVGGTPGGAERAVLVGTDLAAAPADAALYNGAIAHALDYDDTNHPAYAHPSTVIVPALFAVAPLAQSTGRELVTAYILGLEVMGKLGRALNTAHYKQGWHPTATFGTLAATVAASRLLRLTVEQATMALGIAASAAGGLRVNFGSMVKPLHAGYAARNGVLAALLAREGFVASGQALEHKYGYCNVFNHGLGIDLAPLAAWGEPLEILTEYGLALKPYPSCGATHTAIEAALAVRSEIAAAPIRSVRAGVSEMAFEPLIYVMPKTALEGKFSLHYCVAAALVDGAVNLATFSSEKIANPAIRALIPKIAMEIDERVRDGTEFPAVITVETASGKRYERLVPLAMGKPERWMETAQIRDKFRDCAGRVFGPGRVEQLFDLAQALDDTALPGALFGALRCDANLARAASH